MPVELEAAPQGELGAGSEVGVMRPAYLGPQSILICLRGSIMFLKLGI